MSSEPGPPLDPANRPWKDTAAIPVTGRRKSRWYRSRAAIAGYMVLAFLIGIGVGGSADEGRSTELEVSLAELAAEREELAEALAQHPAEAELERVTERYERLKARHAALEKEIAERDAEIEEHLGKLAKQRAELAKRTEEPAERAPTDTHQEPRAQAAGGCAAGQVDINTASISELQRIHEIGPARAEQIVSLRPFRSVDDLTRVSGIAEGRLGGIKEQGLACVD